MISGAQHELYHEIFGSVLDRSELTPYLLRDCDGYQSAMKGASLMMGNRGFAVVNGELEAGEKERAAAYIGRAVGYMRGTLFPTILTQLRDLSRLASAQKSLYGEITGSIKELDVLLSGSDFSALVKEDPRHLFLLASAAKYPHLFRGHSSGPDRVPPRWRLAGCSILKMCHLIKAIEEDSQDIYDYACLGFFFEANKIPLTGLFDFPWSSPGIEPEDENARRAFVKLSAFFRKLHASVTFDREKKTLVFNSGDGVDVEIAEIKSRMKSPESMFAKLGKDSSEEAYDIRDVLAVTFILKNRDDSLTLFHALQKQGVILQENTASGSITQTLFDGPEDMTEAVNRLMSCLLRREGIQEKPQIDEIRKNAEAFYKSLSTNAEGNPHSFSVPVRQEKETGRIRIPGIPQYREGDGSGLSAPGLMTRQHTLPVELRISDIRSWELSELRGEAHHSAYKCRQLLALLDRLFSPLVSFPADAYAQLRKDQNTLFI
jgi:uncharacterized protein (TIGR04562 family)